MEAEERTNGTGEGVAENRSMLVLYGTETGKSQEIAQEIGRAAEGLRFQTQVEEMNDVPLVSSTTHHHRTKVAPKRAKVNFVDGIASRKSYHSVLLLCLSLRPLGKETYRPTPPPSGRAF